MANINAPTVSPTQKPRTPAPAWRLPDGVMNAAENHLESASSSCEWWEWGCATIVVAGVLAELAIAWIHPPYDSLVERWGSVCADAAVALGIVGEVIFGRLDARIQTELRRRSNDRLGDAIGRLAQVEFDNGFLEESVAEANQRAAEADLKRVELEANLQPRMTDQRQFDLIQTLRGKVEEISVIHTAASEPRWFATSLRDAFFIAGIRVGLYRLPSDNPTQGVFVYDPAMRGARNSEVCEVLVDVFRGTQTPVATLTGLPIGADGAPTEYPALIIGEKFLVPPHIAKAMQTADAAYAKMKRRGPA